MPTTASGLTRGAVRWAGTAHRAARATALACAALLVALTAGVAQPRAAGATTFGIGDQQPAAFGDVRLRALGLSSARLIVPWDAATSEPAQVQAWLNGVAAAGLTPHVAFEHLRADRCPGSPCVVPTPAQYRAAIAAFIARFPQVRSYTTWNEANHSSQPLADRPELAAAYWTQLSAACPGCTIVAGDVLDSGRYLSWVRRFSAAAPVTPQRWGLHNYGDVTYGRSSGTTAMLAATSGELWIEETGGIYRLLTASGRVQLSASESRAAASVTRAFAIAAAQPRITRMYLYQWQATAAERWDSGLLRPDGTARASYAAAVAGLAAARGASGAGEAEAVTPRISRVRWGRKGRLEVRVTCPKGSTCSGTLRPQLRTKARGGRRWVLRSLKRKRYRTTTAKRSVTIRFTTSQAQRRRARRAGKRRVKLRLAAKTPSTVRLTVTRSLRRP